MRSKIVSHVKYCNYVANMAEFIKMWFLNSTLMLTSQMTLIKLLYSYWP